MRLARRVNCASFANRPPPISPLFPYTTLFRSSGTLAAGDTANFTETYTNKNVGTHKTLTISATGINKRSEEHTSELQSHHDLVCRLLLAKKKGHMKITTKRRSQSSAITNMTSI